MFSILTCIRSPNKSHVQVIETGDKFIAGVIDTGNKIATVAVDTGDKFIGGVVSLPISV